MLNLLWKKNRNHARLSMSQEDLVIPEIMVENRSPSVHSVLNTETGVVTQTSNPKYNERGMLLIKACQDLEKINANSQMKHKRFEQIKYIQSLLKTNEDDAVYSEDEYGNTALHYAALAESSEIVMSLLKAGSYIGHRNKAGISPIEHIPSECLSDYFDDCLRAGKHDIKKFKHYKIDFNYRCLLPHQQDNGVKLDRNFIEMQACLDIAKSKPHQHLLKHPIFSSFISLKESFNWPILLSRFFIYVFFDTLLITYVLSCPFAGVEKLERENASHDSTITVTISSSFPNWNLNLALLILNVIALIIRLVVQLVLSIPHWVSRKYFLEVSIIVLELIWLIGYVRWIEPLIIILCALEVIDLTMSLPRISILIEIARTNAKHHLNLVLSCLILIIPFLIAILVGFIEVPETSKTELDFAAISRERRFQDFQNICDKINDKYSREENSAPEELALLRGMVEANDPKQFFEVLKNLDAESDCPGIQSKKISHDFCKICNRISKKRHSPEEDPPLPWSTSLQGMLEGGDRFPTETYGVLIIFLCIIILLTLSTFTILVRHNTPRIINKAEIRSLIYRTKLLARIENIIVGSSLLRNLLSRLLSKRILFLPEFLPLYGISVTPLKSRTVMSWGYGRDQKEHSRYSKLKLSEDVIEEAEKIIAEDRRDCDMIRKITEQVNRELKNKKDEHANENGDQENDSGLVVGILNGNSNDQEALSTDNKELEENHETDGKKTLDSLNKPGNSHGDSQKKE